MRLATVYGPNSRGEDVISIFAKNTLEGRKVDVKGDGMQIRSFINVDDLAEGCVKVLSENCCNKTLTIAGKEQITIRDLGLLFKDIFGVQVSINEKNINNRISDYSGEIENIEESYKILDWKPAFDLETGIKKYVEWCKNKDT